jgi:phosphoribosylcarboxyaminoimidazole (NCAIR) mutase
MVWTTLLMGMLACRSRSITIIGVTAILIAFCYAAAYVLSPAGVPFTALLIAIAGYNIGLMAMVSASVAVSHLRARLAA